MSGGLSVSPEPTIEEAAAIAAALEVTRPVAAAAAAPRVSRWRFSGRWWSKPVPDRRERP